jgi:antirestriction protein ArdC
MSTELLEVPFNATTGNAYAGKNIDRLLMAEFENGYDHAKGWAGYQQWSVNGRQVRKGEHGVSCLTVITVTGKKSGKPEQTARGFRVFHFDQTDELTAENEA